MSHHLVRPLRFAFAAALVVSCASAFAGAPGDPQHAYAGVVTSFQNSAQQWQAVLTVIASKMFWYLAGIEFVWSNMVLALRGGDFSDFVSTNTKSILGIGIFYAFLTNAYTWSLALVSFFLQAGIASVAASGGTIPVGKPDAGNIFDIGVKIAVQVMTAGGATLNPFAVLIDGLMAVIFILIFSYLAALVAVAYVEMFVISGGLVIMLGFGGSSWTNDIAKRSMMFVIAAGTKLFVIYLIVGCSISVLNQWFQAYKTSSVFQSDGETMLGLLGICFLICVLAKQIPDMVQALLSGQAPHTGTAMSTLAAAGAAAAAMTSGGVAAAGFGGAAAGAGGGGGVGGVSEGILAAHNHASSPMTPLGMGNSALNTGSGSTAASSSSSWGGPVSRSNSEMPTAPSREAAERAETPWPSTSSSAGESGGGNGMFRGKTAGGHMADAAGHVTNMATGHNLVGGGGGGMPQLGKPKSGEGDPNNQQPSAGVNHASASGGEQTPVSGSGGAPSTLNERAGSEAESGQGGASSPSSSSIDESSVRQAFSSDLEQPHGPPAGEPSSSLSDANSTVSSGLDDTSLRVMQDPASRSLERDLANDNRYEADRTSIDSSNETRLARDSAPKNNPEKNK